MNALLAIEAALAEAIDPKRALRQIRKAKVWPSDRYFIAIIRPHETWAEGEFCPVVVKPDGSCWPADGMYDLDNDVREAIHYHEGNPRSEAEMEKWMNHYEGTMLREIQAGKTSGIISGIIGPRSWRLVYLERAASVRNAIPVEPGKQYGPALQQEAIDPKRILRSLRMGEFVKVRIYASSTMRQGGYVRTTMGSLEVNSNGQTRNLDVTEIEGFDQTWVERMVRDLRRGQLGGNFGRHVRYWWATDERDVVDRITDTQAPILTVTTPQWSLQMPLINDVTWTMYGWLVPDNLSPEQSAFMQEHGESIWYAMNEGNDFEDDIRDYPDDGDVVVAGHWSVSGDPEKAPEHEGDWSYG